MVATLHAAKLHGPKPQKIASGEHSTTSLRAPSDENARDFLDDFFASLIERFEIEVRLSGDVCVSRALASRFASDGPLCLECAHRCFTQTQWTRHARAFDLAALTTLLERHSARVFETRETCVRAPQTCGMHAGACRRAFVAFSCKMGCN